VSNAASQPALWPVLDYEEIAPTLDYIHRLSQIAAKYTLDQCFERNWGHIVLDVTPRGFATPLLRFGNVAFAVEFALLDRAVIVTASSGRAALALRPGSVAEFYASFVRNVANLGIDPPRSTLETEIADPKRFEEDTAARPFDAAAADKIWSALASASLALGEYQAPYRGPRPRTGIMWGGFDLSATRYTGRPIPPPSDRPVFQQNGMNSEEVAVGFSFGDDATRTPAFYAYIMPAPAAMSSADFGVPAAKWLPQAGLVSLPWEAVRASADPQATVVRFADAVYAVAEKSDGWPAGLLMPRVDGWFASRNVIP